MARKDTGDSQLGNPDHPHLTPTWNGALGLKGDHKCTGKTGQERAWGERRAQLPSVEGHVGSGRGAGYFTHTILGWFTIVLLLGALVTPFYRTWKTAGISVNLP